MQRTVPATYEDGVLRLLEPLLLRDGQRVTVTIFDEFELPKLLVSPEEWADAAEDEISLEQVRDALSGTEGSLSETIVDDRRDR